MLARPHCFTCSNTTESWTLDNQAYILVSGYGCICSIEIDMSSLFVTGKEELTVAGVTFTAFDLLGGRQISNHYYYYFSYS